ncbi:MULTISPECIES: hypothetical protein [Elizabethkingia]|uniref:Yip1 domain-containing protein n=2 Tax=Elizabethkingia anophelis TaxID=1117645 RepID=A0A455ZI94_9FLAO|nr:hypothetical protein [Elizabethkingia anophelis]AIL45351.1 hypothetical protein BD94_1576 [Elizabethkingia anophelis NUHP1]MDV4115283.1 hypothetical protein [Elizabethkingia anophelis]DAC76579.1 TPA_exp: hypothetical protein [Elizabethkingia anophelis]
MKNLSIFVLIIFFYCIIAYLDSTYIQTDSKIIDFLAKDYPSEAVQNYMESKKKWWWIGYAIIPLLIGIKLLLVAFCLNFIKLFDLPGLEKINYKDFLGLTLVAEFTFVIAGFYKFINFYWFETNYDLRDLQTYYPLSLLNFKDVISIEKWLAYPLQLSNIFEILYWGILAYGIWEYADKKISFPKSLGSVAVTYGVGLLFWAGTVTFLILNAQY